MASQALADREYKHSAQRMAADCYVHWRCCVWCQTDPRSAPRPALCSVMRDAEAIRSVPRALHFYSLTRAIEYLYCIGMHIQEFCKTGKGFILVKTMHIYMSICGAIAHILYLNIIMFIIRFLFCHEYESFLYEFYIYSAVDLCNLLCHYVIYILFHTLFIFDECLCKTEHIVFVN